MVLHLLYFGELLLEFLDWGIDLDEVISVQVEVLFVFGLEFRCDDFQRL